MTAINLSIWERTLLSAMRELRRPSTLAAIMKDIDPVLTPSVGLDAIRSLADAGLVWCLDEDGAVQFELTSAGLRCANQVEPADGGEPEESSVATVCIDEDSLDDWWNEQDVELKSQIFLQWSLGCTQAIHDCPEIKVRLGGSIGDLEVRTSPKCGSSIGGEPAPQHPGKFADHIKANRHAVCAAVAAVQTTAARRCDEVRK